MELMKNAENPELRVENRECSKVEQLELMPLRSGAASGSGGTESRSVTGTSGLGSIRSSSHVAEDGAR
jgi:hypothetical protein